MSHGNCVKNMFLNTPSIPKKLCDWRCIQIRLNICENTMSYKHSSLLGSYVEKLLVLLSWCLCDLHFSFPSSRVAVYSDLFHLSWDSLLGRIMKLKNSTVETFKENNMIFTSEGNLHSKKMREDYVASPNQPGVVQTRCKWIIGDVTEVFDRSTWKLGKILKMLKNNYFVIRLADCIQLKEFHISSLRIPRGLEAPQSKPFHAADKVTFTSWEYKVACFKFTCSCVVHDR